MQYGKRPEGLSATWGEAGFTLVELLVALFLFALIAGVVFAAFAAVASGVERGRQSMDVYRVGRAALLRMAQEVSAAMPAPAGSETALQGKKSTGGGGLTADRIEFMTVPYRRYSDQVPGYDLCRVAYYVADNAQGRTALFREEDCSGEVAVGEVGERRERAIRLELTDLAVGLEMTYYDVDRTYEEWPPSGNPTGPLPCRVHLVLTLRDEQHYERAFITTVSLPMRGTCENVTTQGAPRQGAPRR
jgi:prepilin-type N-terminal cleavage/methylation domain-containing protein